MLLWALWYVSTFIMMVILLNFIIAVIGQTFERVKQDQRFIYISNQAQINIECFEILSLFRKIKNFRVIVYSYSKEELKQQEDVLSKMMGEVEEQLDNQTQEIQNLYVSIQSQL